MIRVLTVSALLVWLLPLTAVAQVDITEIPFEDPLEESEARDLMREIRCLVCQNQSIEDSDADLAKDLRILVRERLRAGDSDDQVKAYLVARYGDWVLMEPPVRAGTLILWGSPILFLGAALLILIARRRQSNTAPLTTDEEAQLAALLSSNTDRNEPSS